MTSLATYVNIGPISYVYKGRRSFAVWPYFSYGRKIANTLNRPPLNLSHPKGPIDLEAIALANALAKEYAAIAARKAAKEKRDNFIKNTPKPPTTIKQPSPGKGTPNKNPPIPPPPPPPPDIRVSLCPPGDYFDRKTSKCVPCPTGKQYITGSGCQPCPPGTTGESIHTGCSHIGPDGKSYTFIA